MAYRFFQRIDTASRWTSINPVLGLGEQGFELQTDGTAPKWKVGDGVHPWAMLPYAQAFGTTANSYAVGNDARIVGAAQKASNLADLVDKGQARSNLGLGSAAQHSFADFEAAGAALNAISNHIGEFDPHGDKAYTDAKVSDLSGVTNQVFARNNLGLGSAAVTSSASYDPAGAANLAIANHLAAPDPHGTIAVTLQKASNLNDLPDKPQARTNLGLGSASTFASTAFEVAGAAATAQSAAIAASQPRDGDLTAIAALATTSFGRSVLTQADAPAMRLLLGVSAGGGGGGGGDLFSANNLSDLASLGQARINLGLGSAALAQTADFDTAGAATSTISAHIAASDPHGDRAFSTSALATHVAAADPHSDRAYSDTRIASLAGVTNPANARFALGLGTAAVQNVGAFDVSGAAAGAQAASQPLDTDLTAISGLVSAADKVPYATGPGAWTMATLTAAGRALIDDADAPAQRATLGLGTAAVLNATAFDTVGSAAAAQAASQPLDTDLTNIAALGTTTFGRNLLTMADGTALAGQIPAPSTTVAGLVAFSTNAQALAGTATTVAMTPASTEARINALINAAPGALDTLGEIATQLANDESAVTALTTTVAGKQPLHGNLTALAGLSLITDRLPYANGTGTLALATFTAAGRALIDDVDAPAQRTTLGLGTAAVQNTTAFDAAGAAAAAQAASQPLDATLTSIASKGTAADRMLFTTGVDTWAELTTATYGRSLLASANATAAAATLAVYTQTEIGDPTTDFVATFNAGLV